MAKGYSEKSMGKKGAQRNLSQIPMGKGQSGQGTAPKLSGNVVGSNAKTFT